MWRRILNSFDLDALPDLLSKAPVTRDSLLYQVLVAYRGLFEGEDVEGEYYRRSPLDEDDIYFHHILYHFLDKVTVDTQIAQRIASLACMSVSRGVFEEYLRRYDGPKLRFHPEREYIEFLVGFELLDLETPIRITCYSEVKVLPIEWVMLSKRRDRKELISLIKRFSPPPSLERMRRTELEVWGESVGIDEMWEYYSKV